MKRKESDAAYMLKWYMIPNFNPELIFTDAATAGKRFLEEARMTEEHRVWDKLVKVLDRFKEQAEPLVERLKQLGQSDGRPVGKDPEREKKNLYMREWMRKKREREKAEKAQAE